MFQRVFEGWVLCCVYAESGETPSVCLFACAYSTVESHVAVHLCICVRVHAPEQRCAPACTALVDILKHAEHSYSYSVTVAYDNVQAPWTRPETENSAVIVAVGQRLELISSCDARQVFL